MKRKDNKLLFVLLPILAVGGCLAWIYIGLSSVATLVIFGAIGVISTKLLIDTVKEPIRRALKRLFSIDRVLNRALTKNPVDIKTIEKCLDGNYKISGRMQRATINKKYKLNNEQMTMLDFVAKQGKKDAIEYFLKDIKYTTYEAKEEMLKTVIVNNNVECIELFGGMISIETLAFTVANANSKSVQKAIDLMSKNEKKKIANYKDANGNNFFHLATRNKNPGIFDILSQYGIDQHSPNNEGQTPLNMAQSEEMANTLFALRNEAKEIIQTEDVEKRRFFESIKEKRNLSDALLDIRQRMELYKNKKNVSVAVIGMAGAGKSSLINALIGKRLAYVGDETDATKFPQDYADQDITYVDFPGFGTLDYSYDDFEKQFNRLAYDLIILANDDKIDARVASFISRSIRTNRLENVIFARTHLDSMERAVGGNRKRVEEDKKDEMEDMRNTILDEIKDMLKEEYRKMTGSKDFFKEEAYADTEISKYEGTMSIEENRNMFFVFTHPRPEKARVEELKDFVKQYSNTDKLRKARLDRNYKFINYLKKEYMNSFINKEVAEIQWNLTLARLNFAEVLPQLKESLDSSIKLYIEKCRTVLKKFGELKSEDYTVEELDKLITELNAKLKDKFKNMEDINKEDPNDLAFIITISDPIDISIKDKEGKNILMYATQNIDVLQAIIGRNDYIGGRYYDNPEQYFKDLQTKDKSGKTPLMYAVESGNVESVTFILKYCFKAGERAKMDPYKVLDKIKSIVQTKDSKGKNIFSYKGKQSSDMDKLLRGNLSENEVNYIFNEIVNGKKPDKKKKTTERVL